MGDRILVDRVATGSAHVHRGDVVVFDGTDSFTRDRGVLR